MKAISILLLSFGFVALFSYSGGDAGVLGAAAGAKPVFEDGPAFIRRIRTVQHLGRPHFRVKNAVGTFLYDPVAGGFSSILDKEGNDWVGYTDDPTGGYPAAAATKYRGLPNLVYGGDDDGAGHPGFRKCESRLTARNQITTVSRSGAWEWRWTFYRTFARLDVLKAPTDRKYWFLYEGPAGGKYRPKTTFWATDQSEPSYVIHDHFKGDIHRGQYRYMFFGEQQSRYVFWMLHATPDAQPDHISYLGNQEVGARDSADGMVVAGFGRAANATPMLAGRHSFLVGFVEGGKRSGLPKLRPE